MQTKYIEADGIDFGPQRGSLAELADAESAVAALLASGSYKRYSTDDWSLAVELTAFLCLPADAKETPIEFQIQVCVDLEERSHVIDPVSVDVRASMCCAAWEHVGLV